MIKWPDMVFPPICLWNAPRQDELIRIKLANARARGLRARVKDLKYQQTEAEQTLLKVEQQIKEREFLYYLHSGRFPE
jgi:hypothetical protein